MKIAFFAWLVNKDDTLIPQERKSVLLAKMEHMHLKKTK
jgi:hypothetical protein